MAGRLPGGAAGPGGREPARGCDSRGAHVVATVRGDAPNPLRAFATTRPGDVEVEQVDVVAAQRGRAGLQFLDRHGDPLPR